MMQDNYINYTGLTAKDPSKIKKFYRRTFGCDFTDYGPDYTSLSNSEVNLGIEITKDEITSSVFFVSYHNDLESLKTNITEGGGKISKHIFLFPGGRRFDFTDPSGNEPADWSLL
ncbi:MAG TPA: VOC family protein [Ignavibacteria bacterium]|nr:VOC family protein [Ignavibacteria bacterium]HMR41682.1 VOC family protein [Ignavibacteria bacterium]